VGSDGWLYYGGTLTDSPGASPMSDRALRNAAHTLALFQRFAAAVIAATPIAPRAIAVVQAHGGLGRLARPLSYAGALVLAAVSLLTLSGGGYNPFIYFRF
jgi:hypothetical protein